MSLIIKLILRILLVVVIVAALAIGAVWGFVYIKFKVNAFSVLGTLNDLNKPVAVATVAPKAIDYETDMASAQTSANASIPNIITKDSEGNYTVNDTALPLMISDMTLSDKQMCAIITTILKNSDKIDLKFGDIDLKDYDLKLVQFSFSDLDTTTKTTKFNAVVSISLTKLKNKMTSFPLSLLKGRVPDIVYLSNTVSITKGTNAWQYTVASDNLSINDVQQNKLAEILTIANNFVTLGTIEELNQKIGTVLANGIIGNASNYGFAYALHDAGAQDYDFVLNDEQVKLVIKNLI